MANELPKRAISLTQPWAWLMLYLPARYIKDVENRTRRMGLERAGEVWVHAAKAQPPEARGVAIAYAVRMGVPMRELEALSLQPQPPRGGIVGRFTFTGELIAPTEDPSRRWHMPNQWGAVVKDARPVPFVPCKGALGLWRVPTDVLERLAKG